MSKKMLKLRKVKNMLSKSGKTVKNRETEFSDFCEYTYENLKLYVLKLTGGDRYLAEDIVQNTYLIAEINQRGLLSHSNPAGWLRRTAKNLFYKEKKAAKRINSIETILTDDIQDKYNYFAEIDGEIPEKKKTVHFTRIYSALSVKEKKIIEDYHLKNIKLKEIAADMGENYEYVRKKHYRLVNSIVKKIAEYPNN